MQQLESTIANLNSNTFWAVKIESLPYLGVIANNMTGAAMKAAHGSVEQYFQHLGESGEQKIRITDRKSNGSSYKTIGTPYDVVISDSGETTQAAPKADPVQPEPAKPYEPLPVNPNAGLTGPNGLGFAQIHALMDQPRLERENERLRDENQRLKDKIIEQDKTILKNEVLDGKSEATAKAQTGLLESAMPLLAPLIAKLTAPAQIAPGLGMPAENFTEAKNWAISLIKATDDDSAIILGKVAQGMDASEDFFNELMELMKKHELIPAA